MIVDQKVNRMDTDSTNCTDHTSVTNGLDNGTENENGNGAAVWVVRSSEGQMLNKSAALLLLFFFKFI